MDCQRASDEKEDKKPSVNPNSIEGLPADDRTPGRAPTGPGGDVTPARPSEEPQRHASPCENSNTSRGESDTEDGGLDHNPEPPKELLEKKLIDADNIGDTVFSQHWLFSTLMKLIQVVDSHSEDKQEPAGSDSGFDLDENLQDELCKLWDMSMNPEVVKFLLDFKTVDILTGLISKSKAPRATEICVGILGNMACNETVKELLTNNTKLMDIILLLLESPDAPTLVETTRLLHVCVSGEKTTESWLSAISKDHSVFINICFILQSSTNISLLKNTSELVDKVMDEDDELCHRWSCPELVLACLEACKQTSVHDPETLNSLLHCLQLVSTSEVGVKALLEHWQEVCEIIRRYLVHVCSEDIVVIEGQENSLASALSVLAAIFSTENTAIILSTDCQLVRCVLKILLVTYMKYHNLASENGRRRHHHRRTRTTSMGSMLSSLSDLSAEENSSQSERSQHDQSEASQQEREEKEEERREAALVERTASYDASLTKMLYEVLQGLALDLVSSLSKLASKTHAHLIAKNGDTSHTVHAENASGPDKASPSTGEASDSQPPPQPRPVPKSLEYLNSMCERMRVQYLLYCVQETGSAQGMLAVPRLKMAAEHYRLDRLGQIIEETCPSGT